MDQLKPHDRHQKPELLKCVMDWMPNWNSSGKKNASVEKDVVGDGPDMSGCQSRRAKPGPIHCHQGMLFP